MATSPSSDPAEPHALQASTLPDLRSVPLLSALGSPVPRSKPTADAGRVEQSPCMWHRPLPRLAPLVSSGQGAGRLEEGRGGAGAQEQRHWRQGSPRGGEGRLWPERGGGTAVTGAPPPSRPWDQSCPEGGGRAGQPLPQSRLPPRSDCVQAELQGLCIQPRHHGFLLPSQRSLFPCSFPQACWRGAFTAQMYLVGGVTWACSCGQWLVEGG